MKKLLLAFVCILIVGCTKDSTNDYSYQITVEDYYSGAPLSNFKVILKKCEGGGLVSGTPPCDSVDFALTNSDGITNFDGTYEIGFGNRFDYLVKGNGDYPTTNDIRNLGNKDELVVQLKPFVLTNTSIHVSANIDSIFASIYTTVYRGVHYPFNITDSLTTNLTTIPDQRNQIFFRAYSNDSLIQQKKLEYTPNWNEPNTLKIEIN